jgi:hypothetical protein
MKILSVFALIVGLAGMLVLRQGHLGSALVHATFTLGFGLFLAAGAAGLLVQRLRHTFELD